MGKGELVDIYISGSMAYDRIMDFPGRFSDHILPDKIHVLNVCFTVERMVEKFGGTAGNIAYSLTLLRENPRILATIGNDYKRYFEWLDKNRISVEGIRIIHDEFTAGAYITTDRADNQITGFNPGSMKHESRYPFHEVDPENALAILAPGNLRDMIEYARVYREKGVQYICDPGQSLTAWDVKDFMEWIDGSSILISNDYELEMIMNMTGKDRRGLLNLTKTIITTLGEKGSLVVSPEGEIPVSAARVEQVLDPTGAGDGYRAGLVKGIVTGKDIQTAAQMGAVAATYAVENYGTQEHHYAYEDFLQRYRENFGDLEQ